MSGGVFITGGGGVIGRQLIAELHRREADVVAPRRVHMDVADAGRVAALIAQLQPRLVIHLAAQALARGGREQLDETYRVNVTGTWNVLAAVREHAPDAAVVVASTARVYGDPEGLPHDERAELAPRDVYAATKAAAEVLARAAWAAHGTPVAVLRTTNVYGPGDRHGSRLVPELVAAALAGRPPRIDGDGTQRRDFLEASDAAAAYVALGAALLDPARRDSVAGGAFNAGSGIVISAGALAELVARVEAGSAGRGRPCRSGPANERLTELTGWQPRVALPAGIGRVLARARREHGPSSSS